MSAWKKLSVCLLTLVLWIGIMAMPVFAATASQDGLDVSLTTDKDSYSQGENIEAALSVTNTGDSTISSVSLENLIPEGYKLADGSETDKKVDSLAPGESLSLTTTLTADVSGEAGTTGDSDGKTGGTQSVNNSFLPGTGTNNDSVIWIGLTALSACIILAAALKKKKASRRMLSLFLCLTLAGSLFAGIPTKVFAEDTQGNIDIKTSITVDNADLEIQGVVKYDKTSGSSGEITLGYFEGDTDSIYLDTEETVTFTVDVAASQPLSENSLAVYDENNQFIVFMNDNGQDGDQTPNDSVYTGQAKLSSSEIKVINYFATIDTLRSNSYEICYYRDLTQEEFSNFVSLQDEISSLTFEEACDYIKNSSAILEYTIDPENRTISYQTVYYISGIWEEDINSETKGNGEFAVPASYGINYNLVDQTLSETTVDPAISNKNTVVLRPFHGTQFEYEDFKTTGELLKKGLDGSVTVHDDGDVTLDVMKSLSPYGTILIDSHGTLFNNTTPYMLIGEELNESDFLWDPVYYLQHAGYSADYIRQSIICTNHEDRLAVGGKFFNNHYSRGSLNNSYWFLGTCYSMYDNSISGALTNKGADAVIGFTNVVSVNYCNNVLFETTLNSMLLSADTLKGSVESAKNIYGAEDPEVPGTYLAYAGNNQFRLVSSITSSSSGTLSGKICRASDRSTAVGGASISVYKNDSLYTTKTADDSGNYNIALPAGDYRVEISADGYIPFTAYAAVTENNNYYMETFLLIQGTEGETGIASGKITDAVTGAGVDSAALTIRKGWNNTEHGDIVATAATGSDGTYSASLPIGNYTMYVEKDGYISTGINIIVQPGTTGDQNGSITPVVTGDNSRIVLTWSANPRDLDSHVEGTLTNGSPFHVYYRYKSQYDGDIEVCNLDVDDTTSYGPETITLNPTTDKPYYYYVKKYAGSGTVASSEAQIKMYQNGSLVRTFNVPTNLGNGDYWNVFAIKDGQLIINNTITSSPDTSYAN